MNLPIESKDGLKELLRFDVPLSRYSTFQIGGKAKFFAEPASQEQLELLIRFTHEKEIPLLVIGKGSNILFPDEGFPGLVVTLIHFESNRIIFNQDSATVTASSGVSLYRLALAARNAQMGGIEFLSHVPGTLGGALVMNAGFSRIPGQKHEIGNLVREVLIISTEGETRRLGPQDFGYSYRKSNLTEFIVLEATLRLYRSTRDEIHKEILESFEYRNRVQDLRYPSAGSVFKNPGSALGSSGQLIERAGLKGKRIGGAMISDRHANFIVNLGNARSSDVQQLIQLAQAGVWEKFEVRLEPEIRIISSSPPLLLRRSA